MLSSVERIHCSHMRMPVCCHQLCTCAAQEMLFVSKKAIFKPPKAIRCPCRRRAMEDSYVTSSLCTAVSVTACIRI